MLFILKDFESHDFKYLNSSEKLIISPTVVSHCVALNKPLPSIRPNRPLYCCSMVGMRFCMSSHSNHDTRRAVDLIHFMGGSVRKDYRPKDILISRTVETKMYREAVSNEKNVLTLDWIEQCWKHRDDIYFTAQDVNLQRKYQLKCFQGLNLFFVGFSDDGALDEMKQTAIKHGGVLSNSYESATHAVLSDSSTNYRPPPRLQQDPEVAGSRHDKQIKVVKQVSVEWFWKSVYEERCQPETLCNSTVQPAQDASVAVQQPLRPLQAKENHHYHAHNSAAAAISRRRTVWPVPMQQQLGRKMCGIIAETAQSRASLDNLECSNTSSTIPEHMFPPTTSTLDALPRRMRSATKYAWKFWKPRKITFECFV
uniref:BRCT domain-containing protein n=1 Tax=Ditylenchus dipsaci TaxID=166011 RepID=A0A915DZW3_9BILA